MSYWVTQNLYYMTIPESAVPNPEELGIATRPDDEVTTVIDIGEYLDMKIRAISAHKSQQDAVEFVEMLKQAGDQPFAAREFLYLASPGSISKETDLLQ